MSGQSAVIKPVKLAVNDDTVENEYISASQALQRSATQRLPTESSSQISEKPRPALLRAKSDFGPRRDTIADDVNNHTPSDESEWGIRHGFDTQLASEEWNNLLTSHFYLYYTDKKHESAGIPKNVNTNILQEWRMRDRLKTVSAVLALCLNIGVDPPDVIKPSPCAKEECWIDPATLQATTSGNAPLNAVGKALQSHYEQLSVRTRYKCALDPTVEETKKFATALRKSARNERVLFHYNGHGVPKPTTSGEIWVFNRNYTQYIPISLYDLQAWIGGPSIFVWDCSDAATIIQNYLRFGEKHEAERLEQSHEANQAPILDMTDCIHLAACKEGENLPTNPQLPADVFTACLTSPIKMAVRFFILQNPLKSPITAQDAANIPGSVAERRTPLGELNWIFTAITDTIAWDALPKPLFKKLFRQDLMVAALYRNFLLAQRIMRKYLCHPQSYPEIPATHDHPLWASWDLTVETMLSQLPDLMAAQRGERDYEYQHSNFFAEQLTAFEVYLSQDAAEHKIPEQLPVVLQVLLSQVHRLRALILLSKFLDLGPWAVNLALGIGIFPYVLKLLQSQAVELKPVMIFIWARILAVDKSCQTDLLKDNGYQYFIHVFNPNANGIGENPFLVTNAINQNSPQSLSNGFWADDVLTYMARLGYPIDWVQGVPSITEHRAMCAFIIAIFCKDFPQGQSVCLNPELIESFLSHLNDKDSPLLRQWSCLCLSMFWKDFAEAKWSGIKCEAHQKLCDLVVDDVAEVRTAMLHALTNFLGIPDVTPQIAHIEESIASMVLIMANDGNSMVRKELLVFFSHFIARYQNRILVAAYEQLLEDQHNSKYHHDEKYPRSQSEDQDYEFVSSQSVYASVWKEVLIMSVDPYPIIAENACRVIDAMFDCLLSSYLGPHAAPLLEKVLKHKHSILKPRSTFVEVSAPVVPDGIISPPSPTTSNRAEGYITASLKRTASVAASLKNFAFGIPTPNESQTTTPSKPTSQTSFGRNSQDKDPHKPFKAPLPHGFEPSYNLNGSVPAADKAHKHQPVLLESKFFDWALEFFREPQMQAPEAEEPGSTDYNQRLWRRNRNDRIIAKTQPLKDMAGAHPWNRPKGFWNNGSQPMKICWHQFEDHIIVTDDKDGVSVWDYKKTEKINNFSNGNPEGSKITKVRLINEDDQALLMTGSSDGVIKVFRGYESKSDVELVTSFRALTDLEDSTKSAGLVFEWQQSRGQILVAGDVRSVRVWNAGTETCIADINARSGAPITSLTSDQVEGWLFMAGFGDGALRLYDQRAKPQSALVRIWKEHKAWVTNVHLQRGGQRELISASRSGDVKLWDIRWDKSLKTIQATGPGTGIGGLRALAVHEHAPVFAVGSENRQVKIFSTNGSVLSTFEPYASRFITGGLGGVSAVAFHPHKMMIAGAAYGDPYMNLFACGRKGDKDL